MGSTRMRAPWDWCYLLSGEKHDGTRAERLWGARGGEKPSIGLAPIWGPARAGRACQIQNFENASR